MQSLIKPTMLSPIRLAGYQLLHLTFTASTDALLRDSREVLATSLNILEAGKDAPLFISALEVVRMILARSLWHSEWARDTVGASMIQRTVKSLVKSSQGSVEEVSDIKSVSFRFSIIPLPTNDAELMSL